MKPMHVIAAALITTAALALANTSTGKLPEPWKITGKSPGNYEAGIDYREKLTLRGALFLRSKDSSHDGWAALGQSFDAAHYRGKRVRFTARLKTRDISTWAGIWMRVDSKSRTGVAFYNTQQEPIRGTTDWQMRSAVLDVPTNADTISFGVVDEGTGQVWADDLHFDIVDGSVPVDQMPRRSEPAL